MKYLVDTHTFIWAVSDSEKLSGKAQKIIENIDNEIFVSTLSFWEISLKVRLGKFKLTGFEVKDAEKYAQRLYFEVLPLSAKEASTFSELPFLDNHRDPFDRMLIWQAIQYGYTLISKDKFFANYTDCGLKLLW